MPQECIANFIQHTSGVTVQYILNIKLRMSFPITLSIPTVLCYAHTHVIKIQILGKTIIYFAVKSSKTKIRMFSHCTVY